MYNIKSIGLASFLVLLGGSSALSQLAQDNVEFEGTVPATCAINNVSNGILGLGSSKTLSSQAADGAPGVVDIETNGGVSISARFIGDDSEVGSSATIDGNSSVSIATATTQSFDVNTSVTFADIIAPGSYTVTVQITCEASVIN